MENDDKCYNHAITLNNFIEHNCHFQIRSIYDKNDQSNLYHGIAPNLSL